VVTVLRNLGLVHRIMETVALSFVLVVAITVWVFIAYMMRGITWEGSNSDAAKQVRGAAQANRWRWPSDMHQYIDGKARMKDIGVLMLVVVQRILRDKTSFYPLAVGCALAHCITAVLIFLVASTYWGSNVGLLLFVLYITCLWPYVIVLQGGYQGLALMFLLLSVYFVQMADAAGMPFSWVWYGASGSAFGAMLFSSASSRKFIPLYLGAVLFSLADASQFGALAPQSIIDWIALVAGPTLCAILLILALSHRFSSLKSSSQSADWETSRLNGGLNHRQGKLRGYWLRIRAKNAATLVHMAFSTLLFLFVSSLLFGSPAFYAALLSSAAGLSAVGFLLLFPNVIRNFYGYYVYWIITQHSGHYQLYDDYFQQRIKRTLREGAGGIRWYVRHFWRIAPFHTVYCGVAVLFLAYITIAEGFGTKGLGILAAVLLSVSPIIWGEVTKSPKAALAYFPALIGLLLPIGLAVFIAEQSLAFNHKGWLWLAVFSVAALGGMWNLWALLSDIWPAKMGVAQLARSLSGLHLSSFYTYDTPYNLAFLDALPDHIRNQYEIQYIHTLRDVPEGYAVIPPTSSKSSNFQSSIVGRSGDFNDDPLLTELINSRAISGYAVASFKTFGTSKFWAQIGDVASYRDLVLGEVGEHDRWRGLAWIVDAGKLQADLAKGVVQGQWSKVS
jgi:hypothetical protein